MEVLLFKEFSIIISLEEYVGHNFLSQDEQLLKILLTFSLFYIFNKDTKLYLFNTKVTFYSNDKIS